MKNIIWSGFFVVTYFSVFVYGCAWMSHEENKKLTAKIPGLESRIIALEEKQVWDKLSPSAFKGQHTKSYHPPHKIPKLKRTIKKS